MTTMNAAIAEDYGPPERLRVAATPIPQPRRGQIQVRIAAAAVNPGELRLLGGEVRDLVALEFPFVPGLDFAGMVTEVGAGVRRFAAGDDVFGWAAPRGFPWADALASPPSFTTGTMAEYAVFEADSPALARRPGELSLEEAAALPTAGLTAWEVVRKADVQPGETALVVGATGGVGTVVVPLLAAAGARVIATARVTDWEQILRLGAYEAIDHTSVDTVTQTLRIEPGGIDVIINLILPPDRLAELAAATRLGGRLVTITGRDGQAIPGRGDLTVTAATTRTEPGDLDELTRRAISGQVPVTICRRYSLDDAPRAYRDLIEKHTLGKLVVAM